MVLVGSTLNRLFITSPILGRDELLLLGVCLPGAILRLGRPSVSVPTDNPDERELILPAQTGFKPRHW
jgi:hypothetical protein